MDFSRSDEFIFSLGNVYQLIPNSGIPFTTIERVGPRFFVMPFMVWQLVESTDVLLPRIIAFSWSISLLAIFAAALWLFKHRSK